MVVDKRLIPCVAYSLRKTHQYRLSEVHQHLSAALLGLAHAQRDAKNTTRTTGVCDELGLKPDHATQTMARVISEEECKARCEGGFNT